MVGAFILLWQAQWQPVFQEQVFSNHLFVLANNITTVTFTYYLFTVKAEAVAVEGAARTRILRGIWRTMLAFCLFLVVVTPALYFTVSWVLPNKGSEAWEYLS